MTSWFREHVHPAAWGAIFGFAATIPMTGFMLLAHRLLPKTQQYALPPQRITNRLAERAGLRKHLDRRQLLLGTLASHFGYGTTCGAVYGLLLSRFGRSWLTAPLFGLLVWAVSYLGWLPAFHILPPTTQEPPGRGRLIVGAHLVWGGSMGGLWMFRRS
ncbi:MAG TPA: hypothetical protein VFB34_04690 [Chloroflexota bacterium]|nr:hypothetical protein [Chloroflexota bacterium]